MACMFCVFMMRDALPLFAKMCADVSCRCIFMRALQVVEVVSPLRDGLSACLIFPSMPEVMRLNKVGSFTMEQLGMSKSIIGDFMKSKKKENGASFEEGTSTTSLFSPSDSALRIRGSHVLLAALQRSAT